MDEAARLAGLSGFEVSAPQNPEPGAGQVGWRFVESEKDPLVKPDSDFGEEQ